METIFLREKLNVIGDHCFKDCSKLKMKEIYNGAHFIGSAAFADCKNLQHVVLPENLTYIPY